MELQTEYFSDIKKLLEDVALRFQESDKKLYGVIVDTDFNKDNIKELEKKGIYFISISDDLVKLHKSPSFTPMAW